MRTKTPQRILLVGVALLLGTGPLWAHHALIVHFDVTQSITLRGTLTKMLWVNPHGMIYLDVKRPDGQVENWAIETGSPVRLVKRGLKTSDFRPGVELIIGGFAAKDGTRSAAGWIITFPDREASFPAQEASFPLGR